MSGISVTLEFGIDRAVLDSFPDLIVAGFWVTRLTTFAERWGESDRLMEVARSRLKEQGLTLQNLVNDPRIAAWRSAFQKMGLKPSTYKSSPEQLTRRLLKGETISTPLPVVDAYCAVSARHVAAMGGYDVVKLPSTEITIRFADSEADRFSPLGGRSEEMPLTPRVVVYASGPEVICYAFNHRDSKNTCLQSETQTAVFFCEGVAASQHDGVTAAVKELQSLLSANGVLVAAASIASADSPSARLTIGD
jgi:DNA/RNA-binding domain of Phe-tRNA-synthetase-like protein